MNIKDSDGTVIFSISPNLTAGSKKTATLAAKHKKPLLHISGETPSPAQTLADFIQKHQIAVLNVGGPRASKEPDIGEFVREVLGKTFLL